MVDWVLEIQDAILNGITDVVLGVGRGSGHFLVGTSLG